MKRKVPFGTVLRDYHLLYIGLDLEHLAPASILSLNFIPHRHCRSNQPSVSPGEKSLNTNTSHAIETT